MGSEMRGKCQAVSSHVHHDEKEGKWHNEYDRTEDLLRKREWFAIVCSLFRFLCVRYLPEDTGFLYQAPLFVLGYFDQRLLRGGCLRCLAFPSCHLVTNQWSGCQRLMQCSLFTFIQPVYPMFVFK